MFVVDCSDNTLYKQGLYKGRGVIFKALFLFVDVTGFIHHTGKLVVRLFAYLSVADTLLSTCKLLFATYFLVVCLYGLTK